MITSMSKADLFTTLFGYNDPAHNPYIKSTKVTAEIAGKHSVAGPVNWKTFGETQKPSESITATNIDTFTYSSDLNVDYGNVSGLTLERNTDRLEISDEAKAGSEANQYIAPYECTDVVDFTNMFCRTGIDNNMKQGILTEERIAEYYGNIAKRLDAAYSEGKFTKDEYDELNKLIADGMELETKRNEEHKAFYAINAKMYNFSGTNAKERSLRLSLMTPEQIREEMQAQISDYVRKYCQYDRSAVLSMFNSVRYGK